MKAHKPSHPGEILKEMYIEPLGLTITAVAEGIKVTRKTLSELINKKNGVSPSMAIRLAKAFGTTPKLWINLQQEYDLYEAEKNFKIRNIKLFFHPSSVIKSA